MYDLAPGHSVFVQDLDHVDRALAEEWSDLRGAHLLVTGGTGFFGIWLVECLLYANAKHDLGLRLSVLSRNPERFLTERAPHLRGRPELGFLTGSVTGFDPGADRYSHILHAASETNLENTADWASRHIAGSIEGTQKLLDLAVAHGTRGLLLTTSGAVYLSQERLNGDRFAEGPSTPADLVGERSVYGQSKRMMEVMAAVSARDHGFRALIARCFAFVGPYLPLDSNYAIGNFMRDALAGRDIVVNGDGTPLRSYMYSADLVIWLIRILLRGESGIPYNVGGQEAMSIGDLARLVASVSGTGSKVVVKQTPPPGVRPSAYLPDLTRAETTLGLVNGIALDEAVRRTLAWNRLHSPNRVRSDAPGA